MSLAVRLISMFGAPGVTWNPADKASDISLSADLLTATRASLVSGENHVNVRSTTPRTAELLYFEVTILGAVTGTSQVNLGVCTASYVLAGSFAVPGFNAESFGCTLYNGEILSDGNVVATIATMTGGDTACFAVSPAADLAWIRKGAGNWNGNPLADPSAGVGGLPLSSGMSGDPLYIVVDVRLADGTGATLNGGSSPFSQVVPAGAVPWGLA